MKKNIFLFGNIIRIIDWMAIPSIYQFIILKSRYNGLLHAQLPPFPPPLSLPSSPIIT